jgi:AcrR family transcriptional regulator
MSRPESTTMAKRGDTRLQAALRPGRGGGRGRILAEATRLFANGSFTDVSMQDVADAAGVTKASLYYHFHDKQDLYTTVALNRIDELRQTMEAAVAEGGALEERLYRLSLVAFDRMEAEVFRPHIHSHQQLDEEHHSEVHRAMDRLQEPMIRCFVEAGADDSHLPVETAAALLGAVMFSLMFRLESLSASALPESREERARLAIRLFLNGYYALARGQ